MKKAVIFILISVLFSLTFVSAIDSIACVPKEVVQGGTITCEIDLAAGVPEKNQAFNITFYNDTAQSVPLTGCSFIGTTQNSPDPIDIIQGCTIPSTWGSSTTGVVNFSLTGLGTELLFLFNVSAATSSTLIVDEIIVESPILLGRQSGVRWTVTKQDTGNPVIGASCTGDILQLIGGNLVPIAGKSAGFLAPISKFAGHALTSFIPTAVILEEGTDYIVEVRCDCIPENGGCMNGDGTVLINRSSNTGLIGIGTSSISTGTWLTTNTITDKNSYRVGETVLVCANVTNPINRSRQEVSIEYNLRCDSGDDSNTNRILLQDHTEIRGINKNTTQMQCHDFKVPDVEGLEKGATNCYGATDVTVLNELLEPLITYSTRSLATNITTPRIHPEIFWEKISRTIYFANVSFNEFDVGVKEIHATINQLMHEPDTHATAIKNFTVRFMNGTAIPFDTRISVHKRFVRFTEEDESVQDIDVVTIAILGVNTTLDEDLNVTVEFVNFEERNVEALEGIENKTGTFHLDVTCPRGKIGSTMKCTITAYIEESQTVEKETDFTCYIDNNISLINFNQMVTRTPSLILKDFLIPSTFEDESTHTLTCLAGYYNLGSRIDTFSTTFRAEKGKIFEVEEKIIEKIKKVFTDGGLNFGIIIFILGVLVFCFVFMIKRRKSSFPIEQD